MFMKKYFVLLLTVVALAAHAQSNLEKYPVYPGCEGQDAAGTESCFYQKVQQFVFEKFQVPDTQKEFKGAVLVLFEVTDQGKFNVLYADGTPDLAAESKRVFAQLPQVTPPSYNGKPTYAKYTLKINIPLQQCSPIQSGLCAVAGLLHCSLQLLPSLGHGHCILQSTTTPTSRRAVSCVSTARSIACQSRKHIADCKSTSVRRYNSGHAQVQA